MKRGALFTLFLLLTGVTLQARTTDQKEIIEKVGYTQNLGDTLPLDSRFLDQDGKEVALRDYFGHQPVLLNFVYFECPSLCTEVLNGLLRTLRGMKLSAGKDFTVLTISIDPREGPALATKKRQLYLERYKREGAEKGWHFLTGTEPNIKAVTKAAGFSYEYDKEIDQYAHASGIVIVTPEGRIARYYFGVEYPTRETRLSLIEASDGKIGSLTDKILLYCYRYDPATGRYGVFIMRVLRIASTCTALGLAFAIFFMLRREEKTA